ncbi:MAG TPA: type I 3-dehydroquinate dehydratase, partial [Myxococcota bacterium]|nr:type I 3-dehydroquinate dehydratase [Myxococcota bacterium]
MSSQRPAPAPRICIASHHTSLAALRADVAFLAEVSRPGTLVEVRLDRADDLSVEAVRGALAALGPERCVLTFRSPEEGGGNRAAADVDRWSFLRQGPAWGVAFVDVELRTLRRQPAFAAQWQALLPTPTGLVVSSHDFVAVPPLAELTRLRDEAEAFCADVVKVAVQPADVVAGTPLLDLLEAPSRRGTPLLGLAMGEAGLWSRVLAPRFRQPAPFTFARAAEAPGTAPGQPTAVALRD